MIAASIWRNVQRHAGAFDARRFASDRFFRLYPPLVAALLVCGVTAAVHRVVAGSASANLLLPGNIQAARKKVRRVRSARGVARARAGARPRPADRHADERAAVEPRLRVLVLRPGRPRHPDRHTPPRAAYDTAGILVLLAAPLAMDNARFYGFLIIWCLGAVWFAALTSGIDGARLTRAAQVATAGFVVAAVAAIHRRGSRTANPHYTGARIGLSETGDRGARVDRARRLSETVYHSRTAHRACHSDDGGVLVHAVRRALSGAPPALRIRESVPRRALDRVQHRLYRSSSAR